MKFCLLMLVIGAYKKRKIAKCGITGAYQHAKMDEFVVIKLRGKMVDILCQKNPTYKKYVVIEKGKKTLRIQLLKTLYGCIKLALLQYELFSGTLVEMGFELNLYDN